MHWASPCQTLQVLCQDRGQMRALSTKLLKTCNAFRGALQKTEFSRKAEGGAIPHLFLTQKIVLLVIKHSSEPFLILLDAKIPVSSSFGWKFSEIKVPVAKGVTNNSKTFSTTRPPLLRNSEFATEYTKGSLRAGRVFVQDNVLMFVLVHSCLWSLRKGERLTGQIN